MINISNLSFYYNINNILFEKLNLQIKNKSIISIYGPSGSGKTTLLKIIGGIIQPKSGQVIYNKKNIFGFNFNSLSCYRNQTVGFAFQDFNLLEDFTVSENINLPFTLTANKKLLKNKKWIQYLISYLEIEKLLNKKVKQISGGEKERVSIIKSMIHQPQILIIDEPGSFLNKELKQKIYSLIKDYAQKNICITTSHNDSFKKFMGFKNYEKNKDMKIYYKSFN